MGNSQLEVGKSKGKSIKCEGKIYTPEAKPQWQAGSEDSAKSTSASKPKQDRVQMFRRRDKDKDGLLTKEEFLSEQSDPDEAPKRFLKFDANGDGFLSQDEFVFSGKSNN
jgi:iduronate 2-sulfatase